MDNLDLKISRKMQKLIRKTEALVFKELGVTDIGVTLMLHPVVRKQADVRVAEFQYVSTLPRHHMYEALDAVVKKWKMGIPDIPPHLKQ